MNFFFWNLRLRPIPFWTPLHFYNYCPCTILENTSNKPNKSTNINTNNTKASNNPENGSKRKRKRKRKNKNKNKLAPEEMPNYNVGLTNGTPSVNTDDRNKKTNNSRIIFQDNEENVNNAEVRFFKLLHLTLLSTHLSMLLSTYLSMFLSNFIFYYQSILF